MALQKAVTKIVYGEQLVFDEAYHQITSITGNKHQIEMQLTTYKNANKDTVLSNKTYLFEPSQADNAARWDKQGYEYLKTTDEFADAIDV
ncbi:MAG: hypothetical protein ABS951_06615 [Solibacillus sp.]